MTREPEEATLDSSRRPLVEELRDARPRIDAVEAEAARTRAERALFGAAAPARVGRFNLLGPIAAGGMGAVYAAYDPQLDRRVALKLLHPGAPRSEVARDRLQGEARALARLDHPNVVPVHEVVTVDGQVVIVMEWVEGRTLAGWERERERSWREIAAVYRDAGRGLAAAHALGLVHRDFKPANAIIGDDGRVRVLDFGLARVAGAAQTEAATGAAPPGEALTAPGELLGTLAYMAPEQLAGQPATAASDQFSFCVALYRALYSAAPFAGTTADELRASIAAGALGEPAAGRGAPGWLRAAVTRGLSASPAARHPSMAALLDELGRERGWARWRTPIAIAGSAGAALTAAWLVAGAPAPSCDGGRAELAAAWDPARRGAVVAALERAGAPGLGDVAAPVTAGLDDYRERWLAMHRAACVEHRDGAQSDAGFDRRMACLRRRRAALIAAVDALGGVDARAIARAREVVAGLPPVADCGDPDVLAAEVEPPADPGTRARIRALEARLADAVALEQLGRSADALRLAQAVVGDARAIGYPPVTADALLTEGRILLFREDRSAASAPLAAAEELSFAHGMLARGVEAAARRIYVDAMRGEDLPGLLRQAAVIEPLSRGLRDGFARPLLLNNLGALHMAMERRDLARAEFVAARAAAAAGHRRDLELTAIDRNLAMVTADPAERAALARGVWERRRAALGDAHLSALEALLSYAKYLPDPGQAEPAARDACERYAAAHPDLRVQRAECRAYQAFAASELGDLSPAAALFDDAAALLADEREEDLRAARQLAVGAAAWCRGDPPRARAAFDDALAIALPLGDAWWVRSAAAQARLGLGLVGRTFGDLAAPIDHLERAVAEYDQLATLTEEVEHKQRLALARMTLANLLRRRGGPSARVAELEQLAAAFYRAAGPASYRDRLAALAP